MNKLKVTKQDLNEIHGLAVSSSLSLNVDSTYLQDPQQLQAFSWTLGILTWLKGKDVLHLDIEVERGTDDKQTIHRSDDT